MLAQYWSQQAYNKLCDMRPWSWLRAEGEFLINNSNTGLVNVTRGSNQVSTTGITSGQLVMVAADQDRQFRVGTRAPMYTIIAVDVTNQLYTLDRVYGNPSSPTGGLGATVLDAYLNAPSDFQRFIAVLDPANNWQLHIWVTEEELNTWDASRSSTGTPWAVASRRLGTQGTFTGRVQFELWPYATAAKNYPFFYIRRPEVLTDSTVFLGPLANASDVLVQLALAEAAEWPAYEDRKNPYFNLSLAEMKRKNVEAHIARLEVLDEEIYMTWLETQSWISRLQFAPVDSRYLQGHDGSYSGFGGW